MLFHGQGDKGWGIWVISPGTMVEVRRAAARTHEDWVGSLWPASHYPLCCVTPGHFPLKEVLLQMLQRDSQMSAPNHSCVKLLSRFMEPLSRWEFGRGLATKVTRTQKSILSTKVWESEDCLPPVSLRSLPAGKETRLLLACTLAGRNRGLGRL